MKLGVGKIIFLFIAVIKDVTAVISREKVLDLAVGAVQCISCDCWLTVKTESRAQCSC